MGCGIIKEKRQRIPSNKEHTPMDISPSYSDEINTPMDISPILSNRLSHEKRSKTKRSNTPMDISYISSKNK